MLQSKESLFESKFNKIAKFLEITGCPADVFVENVFAEVFFESNTKDANNFFTEVERKLVVLNEKWWNPLTWGKKEVKPNPVAGFGKRYSDVEYSPEAEARFARRDAEEKIGGSAGVEDLKKSMKDFLTGGTGSPEVLLRKLDVGDMPDNKLEAMYILSKDILKYIDNYNFRMKIVRDKDLVDKIRGRSAGIRKSSQSDKLFRVMGYDSVERAEKIIANMSPKATGKLGNRLKNMSMGKFTPDVLASIGMYGYDKIAIAKQAGEFLTRFGMEEDESTVKAPEKVKIVTKELPKELKNIESIKQYATQRMGVNDIEMLRSMKKYILLSKLMRLSSDVVKLKAAGVSWADELETLNKELAKNAGVA